MRLIKSISLAISLLAVGALAACGGDSGSGGDSCTGSETRCDGADYQQCDGDSFETVESCAGSTVCDPTVGCAECTPAGASFCNGDVVTSCGTDGTVGDALETCDPGTCSNGSCGGNFGCEASGVELIYVVTADNNTLLSFDPEKLGTASDPFTVIGPVNCNAGTDIRLGIGQATPFSMSVDRNGLAWVLYSSGEIFHVSTTDASCTSTSFQVGQNGYELFGMGFVSDAAGSNSETLFIAGGSAQTSVAQDLGSIDASTMTVTPLGQLPTATFGPELTGTGDAKLYGYYPGQTSFVAEVNKTSGGSDQTFPLMGLPGDPMAWAFAHYGGKFYIFIQDIGSPRVIELDPSNGNETVVVPNSPHQVVGAGVSTCAPIQVD